MTIPLVTFTLSSVGNLIAIYVIKRNQKRYNEKVRNYFIMHN